MRLTSRRPVTTLGAALGLSTALVVGLTSLGHADVLKNEVAAGGGVGGKLDVTVGTPVAVPYYIQATGGTCDAEDGSAAVVTVTAPAGVTVNGASSASLNFTACEVPQSVSFAASAAGTYAIPVASVVDVSGSYSAQTTAFNLVASAPVSAPVNHAPTVASAAADAFVKEGDQITASGSFADEDPGDTLTLHSTSGAGTFVDNGDGSWSFTLSTDDDVALDSVLVTATDSHGATATDGFDFRADNVAPNASLTKVGTADPTGCTLSVSPTWSDPGTADTHTGVLSWGDGGSEAIAAQGAPLSHGFASAGEYTVTSTVTDDDGGVGTAPLGAAHRVFNKPSGVLQPVNDTRLGQSESQFKLGSTIPVKLTVANCGGASVATLAPTVAVSRVDAAATATTLETVSTATPTTGTAMRYDATGAQYIYNLATKNLSEGRFKITISDPTFASPVTATVTIKK